MKVLTPPDLRDALVAEARGCNFIRLATAYIGREARLWTALKGLPNVELLVSEEWDFNNPHTVHELEQFGVAVRGIERNDVGGKLHAKAFVGRRARGRFAGLGSANLTGAGLTSNRELYCFLEDPGDAAAIDAVEARLAEWWRVGLPIDWSRAKALWAARSRATPILTRRSRAAPTPGAWLIKASPGAGQPHFWAEFLAESVIAIGWEDIVGDPAQMNRAALESALQQQGFDAVNAATFEKFYDQLDVGDSCLVLRGYNATQTGDIVIFGFGTLLSRAYTEPPGGHWWRFKAVTRFTPVDATFPVTELRRILGLKSCMSTLHATTVDQLVEIRDALERKGNSIPWSP